MKIAGMCIVGAGEADRYLEITLKEFKRLCDKVIIATNDATQKEKDLIEKYGFEQYEDNREWGKEQPHIKTDLLARFSDYRPDWVVALDADEQFCKEVDRETLEKLASGEEIGWYFMIVNLYGDKNHFAHDVGIKRFWNVRFYKYMPELGLQFQEKRLHCGLGPPYAYKFGWYAPYYINHYGLMTESDRKRKYERYDKYDPNAKFIDKRYYDDLRKTLRKIPFNRSKLLEQLVSEPTCQPRVTPKPYLNQEEKIEVVESNNTLLKGSGLFKL
jgi:hypothetical protein